MKSKTYKLLSQAVEEGVAYGVRRYYKHLDNCPTEEELRAMSDCVTAHALDQICEWFDFEDLPNG